MNIEMYRIFSEIQRRHWWFVTRKKIVMDTIDKYLDKNDNIKVLDIGCGTGVMLNALEKVGQAYGMDMSDDAINFSKEIFKGKMEKRSFSCIRSPIKRVSLINYCIGCY